MSELDEDAAARELDQAGQDVTVGIGQGRITTQAPEQLGVAPGEIPGVGDRPHRHGVVDILWDHVDDVGDQAGLKPARDLALDLPQEAIDALVVGVLRAVAARSWISGRHATGQLSPVPSVASAAK